MRIQPANGGVVLEPILGIGDDHEGKRPRSAFVLDVGRGVPWLKRGDAVLYDVLATAEFAKGIDENASILLVNQRDILGKLDHMYRWWLCDSCYPYDKTACTNCGGWAVYSEFHRGEPVFGTGDGLCTKMLALGDKSYPCSALMGASHTCVFHVQEERYYEDNMPVRPCKVLDRGPVMAKASTGFCRHHE